MFFLLACIQDPTFTPQVDCDQGVETGLVLFLYEEDEGRVVTITVTDADDNVVTQESAIMDQCANATFYNVEEDDLYPRENGWEWGAYVNSSVPSGRYFQDDFELGLSRQYSCDDEACERAEVVVHPKWGEMIGEAMHPPRGAPH